MTPAQISVERLRELLDKATPGPWALDQSVDVVGYADSDVAALIGDNFSNNGPLIVYAVNALPALLQQLAETTEDRDSWRRVSERLEREKQSAERAREAANRMWREAFIGVVQAALIHAGMEIEKANISANEKADHIAAYLAANGGPDGT